MSTVAEIKDAIARLNPRERAELFASLQNWPEDEWDRQMAADSEPGGKLHKLKLRAEEEARQGKLKDFPN